MAFRFRADRTVDGVDRERDADRAKAVRLHRLGLGSRAIGERLGRSQREVRRMIREAAEQKGQD